MANQTGVDPQFLAGLFSRLCVKYGFCLLPEEQLAAASFASPDDFADAVFRAEGMDPLLSDSSLWRDVRDEIAQVWR